MNTTSLHKAFLVSFLSAASCTLCNGAVTISQIGIEYFHTANSGKGPNIAPFAPFTQNDISNDYSVGVFRQEDYFGQETTSFITIDTNFRAVNDLESIMLGQFVGTDGILSIGYANHIRLTTGLEDSIMYIYTQPVYGTNPRGRPEGNGLYIGMEASRFVLPNSYVGGSVGLDGTLQEFDLLANNTYRITHLAGTDLGPPIRGTETNKVLITFGSAPSLDQIQRFNEFVVVPEPSAALLVIVGAIGCLTRRSIQRR